MVSVNQIIRTYSYHPACPDNDEYTIYTCMHVSTISAYITICMYTITLLSLSVIHIGIDIYGYIHVHRRWLIGQHTLPIHTLWTYIVHTSIFAFCVGYIDHRTAARGNTVISLALYLSSRVTSTPLHWPDKTGLSG